MLHYQCLEWKQYQEERKNNGDFKDCLCVCETDDGYLFSYDSDYIESYGASAVSLTMPLYKQTYTSKTLFPFFDGLIPEGWMLQVVSRNWKINIQDRFGLLIVSCKDCIGNVSIKEVKE